MKIRIRRAVTADVPVLRDLIDASVRGLQTRDYLHLRLKAHSQPSMEWTLSSSPTEHVSSLRLNPVRMLLRSWSVAAAGASERPFMAETNGRGREAALLDPQHDAAKIRASLFIRWARRGIGSMILEACENAAIAAGFTRFEMGATLTGVPLYQARGYVALENLEVPLANGESLPIVRMEKQVPRTAP